MSLLFYTTVNHPATRRCTSAMFVMALVEKKLHGKGGEREYHHKWGFIELL
jgi:hypothetical protein